MGQRFDIEHRIRPPLRRAITLTHKSGLIIYVAQGAFGPTEGNQSDEELTRVAKVVAEALKESE